MRTCLVHAVSGRSKLIPPADDFCKELLYFRHFLILGSASPVRLFSCWEASAQGRGGLVSWSTLPMSTNWFCVWRLSISWTCSPVWSCRLSLRSACISHHGTAHQHPCCLSFFLFRPRRPTSHHITFTFYLLLFFEPFFP